MRIQSITIKCELCLREVNRYTVHHLIPKAKGGKLGETADLCGTCHKQIHALFSEATLAKELCDIRLLNNNSRIQKYLKWIRKQKHTGIFPVRRSKSRK